MSNNKGIYEGNKFIDNFVYINMNSFFNIIKDGINILNLLRKEKFDLFIELEIISKLTAILSFISKSKYTIGYTISVRGKNLFDFSFSKICFKNCAEVFESFFSCPPYVASLKFPVT